MHRTRSGSHGLYLPATFHPQGLVTLSTAFSLVRLAGLVSCRQRPGGFPFGAFSSLKVIPAFSAGIRPACRYRLDWQDRPKSALPCSNGPASGYILERVPRESAGCLARHGRRILPWVSSLSGILTGELGNCFQPPPPTRLAISPVTRKNSARRGVSITHRPARLREPGVPPRVSVPPASWRSAAFDDPGYAFTFAALRALPPVPRRIFGSASQLPKVVRTADRYGSTRHHLAAIRTYTLI